MNGTNETCKTSETGKASKKPRLLTLKEAAKVIDGLTEYRIRQMCLKGDITYHKFGNKFMISERSLLEYFGEKYEQHG